MDMDMDSGGMSEVALANRVVDRVRNNNGQSAERTKRFPKSDFHHENSNPDGNWPHLGHRSRAQHRDTPAKFAPE